MPDDLAPWLDGLGLGRYAEAFAENEIDLEVLPDLTEDDLRELGLPMGPRKKLLRAIAELQRDGAPPAAGAPAAPPPSAAERRQLTVLFADLVGSTALSAHLDPEDYRELMRGYQEAVTAAVGRYNGHVAKYLGDGVLAYFGWPQAHEDDAERAVRAGLGIVEAVAGLEAGALQARIGIATGNVVVGDLLGEGVAEAGAVSGETPNLAARLQEIAEPGSVVVADGTRQLLGGLFECEDRGSRALKGIAAPAQVWRIVGERRTESRFEAVHVGRLTGFTGREHEIALLGERWQRAEDGEGQVVLLSGEAGIGKSRVLQVLRERVADQPHTRLRYQCSPHYEASALHPVISQLERAAGLSPDDDAAARLDKIERMLARSTDDVAAVAPLFAALLSVPAGDRYPPLEVTAQRQKELTLAALTDQLLGLARRQPVLLIFEDVQWVDPTTLESLGQIIDRIQGARVLAIVTYRPSFVPPWRGYNHMTMLTLNRLSRGQCSAMVEDVTEGKALPREVLDQIVAKTDGVPLFVEELTKTVLESGLLRVAGDRYELAGPLPPLAIPATLHDSLMARLDRLAPIKEVAQTGAAIGREFPFRLLAAVSPGSRDDLEAALAELVEAELIFRRGVGEDATYVFKHALVQDAAYESLLKSGRQQLHQRIADALERAFPEIVEARPEIVAHHYAEAGLAEPAIGHWQRAGERAAARSTHAEAIAHFERALATLQTLPPGSERDSRELDLRLRLGGSHLMARGHGAPGVEASYNRAVELCRTVGETSQLVRALFGLWRYYVVVPRYETCDELARQLLDLGERSNEAVPRVLAHYAAGTTRLFSGEPFEACRSLEAALAIYHPDQRSSPAYQQGQDPAEACRIYRALALWLLGFPEAASASGAEALAHSRRIGDPFSEGHACLFHAILDMFARNEESVRIHAGRAVQLDEEYGFSAWGIGGRFYCEWLAARGDSGVGAEGLRRTLKMWGDVAARINKPIQHSLLGRVEANAGRIDEALAEVDRGLEISGTAGERWWDAELHRLRGTFLLERGDGAPAAEECFRAAIDVARGQRARSLELRAATSLAALWHAAGRDAEARDLLAPIHGWFTEGLETPDMKEAGALLDALTP